MGELRLARQRLMLWIAYRDLNGLAALDEVTHALSYFAQQSLAYTAAFIRKDLKGRFGLPSARSAGYELPLMIVGMGKLGGKELNLSSDIDLIFSYPEAGETAGPRVISNQEFFVRLGQKIVQLLAEPFMLQQRPYNLSASVGVVMFSDGCNADQLLQRADLAMYDAKERGRNGVRFFNQQMQADVSARAELAAGLRQALLQQQFVLYFQPQLQHGSGVVGAEVLLRWQHPTLGMMAPGHFIPVAESSGQIQAIGYWVLQQSCMQLAEWARHSATANWYLAVNISARQLHATSFVADVRKALQDSGAKASCLVLELTESQLLQDIDSVIDKMQQLTALGVRFSLDDFGTGYSSLSYLKRLPLQQHDDSQLAPVEQLADDFDLVAACADALVGKLAPQQLREQARGQERPGRQPQQPNHLRLPLWRV